jgi:hypothetical protein
MHAISVSWSIASNDGTMAIFLNFLGVDRMTFETCAIGLEASWDFT